MSARKPESASLKGKLARRANWLTRRWCRSAKGNPFINAYGYNTVVFTKGGGWTFRLSRAEWDEEPVEKDCHGQIYPDPKDAALGAFDLIEKLKV